MEARVARIAYRAAIGKLSREATYIHTYDQGIVPVFTVSPQSILEPYVRIILQDTIINANMYEDLRVYGLNGYIWEYELFADMCKTAAHKFNPIHESESEYKNEYIDESESQGSFYDSDDE